jgi:uncharacterized protein YbjT (DUF2867 family)
MTLVTGATGEVGRAVVAALVEKGTPVRALVRAGSNATLPGAQIVEGNFEERDTLAQALVGIDTMFLLSPGVFAWETAAIELANRCDLTRIVKQSVLGADDASESAILSTHSKIEGELIDSGVPYTILRPNAFMQNFTGQLLPMIKGQGAIMLPAGDAKISFIDVRDIAAVAVAALTTPEFESETLELTGPEALGYVEAANVLSKAAGREIKYANVPDEIARQAMIASGMPAPYAKAVVALYRFYRSGGGAEVTNTIQETVGRPARTLETFASDHAPVLNG